MTMTATRGFVCLDCGTEYATVDELIDSGHLRGACPQARPAKRARSDACTHSDHDQCDGHIPGTGGGGRGVRCRCSCHEDET